MEIRDMLEALLSGQTLARDDARTFMEGVLTGEIAPERVALALGALRVRNEDADELLGFRDALLAHAALVPSDRTLLVDTCGTGGDGLRLFNLSTATAIVVAAAGVPVAKHGNRSVSSACGSTDVLEAAGVTMVREPERLAEALERLGLVFLHAPFHHPALGRVAPLRQALGVMTTFNLLGPLVNPAPITHQVVGVPRPRVLPIYAALFAARGLPATIVHGRDGADEALPGAPFAAIRVEETGSITTSNEDPRAWGVPDVPLEDLRGGDAARNAYLLHALLRGETEGEIASLRWAVALNSALVLERTGAETDRARAVQLALSVIDGGHARRLFSDYVAWSQS